VHCAICNNIAAASDGYLFETDQWLLRHSSETNIEGYLILEARRHILDLSQASEKEIASYGPMLALATRAIRRVVAPEKVYTFTLAEAVPHLHVHLIPRGKDMPRAWRGRGILAYPLTPAVNPASLPQVCQSLRQELKRQILIGQP
jgi:diadenosine tetraphosphate (Ap4A) HIT family hydrolase